MKNLNVVLKAAAVLGTLFAFSPRRRARELKNIDHERQMAPSAANAVSAMPSRDITWLLESIDQKLEQLLDRRSLKLPWTALLDESGDRRAALEELFARRQDLELSLMEEQEFSSCAQLTVLSYLLEIMRAQDEDAEQTKPRVSMVG